MIKQVANSTVNEVGTEAAAVSVAAMDGASPGTPETPRFVEFYANRPFIFAITEQTTGAILFLGCYR
jgi:serpin B